MFIMSLRSRQKSQKNGQNWHLTRTTRTTNKLFIQANIVQQRVNKFLIIIIQKVIVSIKIIVSTCGVLKFTKFLMHLQQQNVINTESDIQETNTLSVVPDHKSIFYFPSVLLLFLSICIISFLYVLSVVFTNLPSQQKFLYKTNT